VKQRFLEELLPAVGVARGDETRLRIALVEVVAVLGLGRELDQVAGSDDPLVAPAGIVDLLLTGAEPTATVSAVQDALSNQLSYALGSGHGRAARHNGHVRSSFFAPGGGAKRSSGELEAVQAELISYLKHHAGERIEQIAVGMGISTKELSLPVRKLVAAGQLRTEGQKRATQYFLA
jgi:hypothetical protein